MKNKENEKAKPVIKDFWQEVDEAGGINNYYLQLYTDSLEYYRKELPLVQALPPLPEGESYLIDEEYILSQIHKIETLLVIYQALHRSIYDHSSLFMDIDHNRDYFETVLFPMRAMIEAGDIDGAWNLLNQPRRHHR